VQNFKVTLKTRGKKLSEVMEALSEAKERVLAIIRVSKVAETRSYQGMTRGRYVEMHEGRQPEADGLVCFQKLLKDGRTVEAVLLSKQHADEWNVDFVEEEGVQETETHARSEVWHINALLSIRRFSFDHVSVLLQL
jgi:hypothetical protein